jgi:hypothetical protein
VTHVTIYPKPILSLRVLPTSLAPERVYCTRQKETNESFTRVLLCSIQLS